jgi:LPS-assembly lipoprotein
VAAQLAEVEIGLVPDRLGQNLRNELIDRMYRTGRPVQPTYRLEIEATSYEQRTGYQKDATATRAQIRVNAFFVLRDGSGKVLLSGQDAAVVGYSIVSDQYAVLVSERDAYERAAEQLAESIVRRLSVHFQA